MGLQFCEGVWHCVATQHFVATISKIELKGKLHVEFVVVQVDVIEILIIE